MGNQHAMDLFEEEKKFIKAQVLHTIFHNEENLYSVVSMKVIETNETYDEKKVMINGHFPRMHEDEVFTLTGHFTPIQSMENNIWLKHLKRIAANKSRYGAIFSE